MPAPLRHIESSPQLPKSADAVVIGGGIVGAFAAYYLAQRGIRVALVEKGRIGGEQSSRNWGWCRQQNRDARELPLATKSLDLWERFTAESGEQTGFRRCGLFYLSNDEAELARWAAWRDFAKTVGVTSHMLDSTQATERGHATGRVWKGGVFSPTDGTADPSLATPAVAAAIMKLGGTVHQNCAARGIEQEAGRLSGVVTESGTVKTRMAVLAGGAWASSFCRQLGIRFPQASIRQSILAVSPGAEGLPAALHTAGVSVTRRSDGG
jgi:glycine/D-amino acid oxidase-like deaminating enzyme